MGGGYFEILSFSFGAAAQPGLVARVHVDREGGADARGVAVSGEERSTGALVALPGGTQASCADADGDGVAGITAFTIEFGQPRGDARLLATVVPDRGEIDEGGWHPVAIGFGDTTVSGRVRAVLPGG